MKVKQRKATLKTNQKSIEIHTWFLISFSGAILRGAASLGTAFLISLKLYNEFFFIKTLLFSIKGVEIKSKFLLQLQTDMQPKLFLIHEIS